MIDTACQTQNNQAKTQRELKFCQAINEALDVSLSADPSVYLIGLGTPDPKGVFGTTVGLVDKHGPQRVMDMPVSENGMTGIAIGSALTGMRPVMCHQRLDFALLAMEQIVNQAANWRYMYGGQNSIPLVIRLIVGRGWGQGPQHSQSLQSWFGHIPGLKVVMPTTAYDAKGLLISSIEDNNPVIFIEHRWLHNITGYIPEGLYRVPIGKAAVVKEGRDITIVSISHMTIESIRAAEKLADCGISAEIVDVRSLRPLDDALILQSVKKTGRLLVADTAWQMYGLSSEVIARVAESGIQLRTPPKRITLPDAPSPCSPGLSRYYYPHSEDIVTSVRQMFGFEPTGPRENISVFHDVPDPSFTGPF